MSRLYEALRRALPPEIADGLPPGPTKTTEVVNKFPFELAGTKAVVASAEAPAVTVRAGSRLVALTEPNSLGAEKFRVLVTRLDHLRKKHEPTSLQVIGSAVNEGKTLVAANLAVTLAKYAGSKTLLIEGDLHRPALARLFGLDELQGLTHWWVSPNSRVADFVRRLKGMPLWFLPAGKVCDQPSHILQSARFAEAFAQLAARFEWIVVDSTPMRPIVDVNLWSRLVGGSLLVVREGITPVKALVKGLQALDQPKLIGVVVNEASEFDQGNYARQYYQASKEGTEPRCQADSSASLSSAN
jgi:capsular exopolysaccharide synthesis family protein